MNKGQTETGKQAEIASQEVIKSTVSYYIVISSACFPVSVLTSIHTPIHKSPPSESRKGYGSAVVSRRKAS